MKKAILIIALTAMITGGLLVIYLSNIPFGLSFTISVTILFVGVVGSLLWTVIQLLRSKRVWKKILALPFLIFFILVSFVGIGLLINTARSQTFLANSFLKIIPASAKGAFTSFPYSLSKEQWRADLQYLKDEFPRRHANPFLYMSATNFYKSIDSLSSRLDQLADAEIAFGICSILSLVKDGHTQAVSVAFNIPPFIDSRLFPLRIYHFNDGVYVTDGGRDNRELSGCRITKIGNTPIEAIIKEINQFVPGENEYYKMRWAFPYLLNAGLLQYKGFSSNSNEAEFTFQDQSGKQFKKKLTPVLPPLYLRWFRNTLHYDDPSRKEQLHKNYWYEYNQASKTLFVQINVLQNQEGAPTLKSFAGQLNDLVAKTSVERCIIDMRNCNGGDNTLIEPLISFFSNTAEINRHGKLFTLIGRQTFSAAVSFIAAMERNTHTIFVGEPAGSGPNQCGDVQTMVLPNSRLLLQVSARYHQQSFYNDLRLAISPAIHVGYTYQDWAAHKDPALTAVDAYKPADSFHYATIDPAGFDVYTGRFIFDEEKILAIVKTEKGLAFEVNDHRLFAKAALNALDPRNFITANELVRMEFIGLQEGQFQQIRMQWGMGTDTLHRLPANFLSPAELINNGRIEEAIKMYRQGKAKGFIFSATTDFELNRLGYKLLNENKPEEAISLFTLNTELFPFLGNAWDSLAEAWLKKGDAAKAKIFYTKALELNPENNGARKALEKL